MNSTKDTEKIDIPQQKDIRKHNNENESACSDVDDSKAVFDDYAALKPQYKGPNEPNPSEFSHVIATKTSDAETCTMR